MLITRSALSDDALPAAADETDIFAEAEPNQKERIIRALRKAGHVVGYMGDGIHDAPALRAADVSISVQEAVDVAKEAADIALLEPDLAVLEAGVREGRRTFANTLEDVFMATSANFGKVSSVFDYLTLGVLLWFLRAGAAEFRTGWFLESVVSTTLVILVVRARGSFVRSRPWRALLLTTLGVAAATSLVPHTGLGTVFGFVPLPPLFLAWMGVIVLRVIASAELGERWFYQDCSRWIRGGTTDGPIAVTVHRVASLGVARVDSRPRRGWSAPPPPRSMPSCGGSSAVRSRAHSRRPSPPPPEPHAAPTSPLKSFPC